MYRVTDPVRGDDPAAFDDGVLEARPITPAALAAADVILLGAPARQGGLCGEMRLFLDSLAPLQAGVRPGSAPAVAGGPGARPGEGGAPGATTATATATATTAAAAAAAATASPSRPGTPTPPLITGPVLKGKVGAAFTSIGGPSRGAGGAETVLASIHATLLAHGMVVVGAPPSPAMAAAPGATTLGAVAAEGYNVESVAAAPAASTAAGTAGGGGGGGGGGASAPTPAHPPRPPPLTEAEVRIAFAAGQWAAQVGRLLHDAELDVDGGDGRDGGRGGPGSEEAAAGLCVDGFGL